MGQSISFGQHSGAAKFTQPFRILFQKRSLILQLVKREISGQYVGSMLGSIWALIHPYILLAIYVVLFTTVYQTRVQGWNYDLDYAAYIIIGLIPWFACQEGLMKSCVAIVSQTNLVKQVVFPIEVLPSIGVVSAFVTQGIGMTFVVLYTLIKLHSLYWTYMLLPVLIAIHFMILVGAGWALSSLSVYFRDVKEFVRVLLLMAIYLLPALYPPGAAPGIFQRLMWFNPFSHLIYAYQDTLFYGTINHPWSWLITALLAVTLFFGGHRLFSRLKVGFANVI